METAKTPQNAGRQLQIAALEPYYGGSHQAFLDRWRQYSRHRFSVFGLPAHSWKWRMRHGAVTLAEQAGKAFGEGKKWDVLFCSDMLNLAELRGLCHFFHRIPAVVYFHENQLTYPVRKEEERDFHFAYTNFTTCLAADAVWFNSAFHRDDFLAAVRGLLQRMPDYQSLASVDEIAAKSTVQPPGVEAFQPRGPRTPGPLRIVWAARWEHDKNPEDFFAALDALMERGVDFRVSVLGEQFRDAPPVFAEYRRKLAGRIEHWGFLESTADYRRSLQQADAFVSTAMHEFFGIAAVEAISAGCYPLLPSRLAYPELLTGIPDQQPFLYDGSTGQLAMRLEQLAAQVEARDRWEATIAPLQSAIARFSWTTRAAQLDDALTCLAE